MARLRPRGPEPGLARHRRVVALPAFPGLGVTATFVPGTAIAAEIDAPGLDVTAIPTGHILAAFPSFPGLGVAALAAAATQAAATVAFPGLTTRADFFAALVAMRGLDVPKAIVGLPGLGAQLVVPGLDVPKAQVDKAQIISLGATVAAPGLSVAAALDPPGATFRLAPDYRTDWVKLQNLTTPSVVQVGTPTSTGVAGSGGPGGSEATGNVLLASKNKSGPGWAGAFTLKRTDAYAPAAGNGGAFLILYFGAVGDGSAGRTQVGPYPWSATYDPLVLTGSATSFAVGGDQWPMTRTPADTLLAAAGDDFGWLGDQTKSTMSLFGISGTPPSLTGVNKFRAGSPNRKPNAILALGGSTVLLWHVNQTKDARVGTYTAISSDGGTTWTFHEAAGEMVFSTAATPPLQVIGAVQAGPGYTMQSSTLDLNYAHLYLNNSGNLASPFTGTNGKIWLCRVKIAGTGGSTANIWNPAKYSFFNGLDNTGAPTWTPDAGTLDLTKYVFNNPVGMGKHFLCGWSELAGRYLAGVTPTAGTLAVYEAPKRWGPWTTLYYGAGTDPSWTGLFTVSLPGPWQTATKLWLAVSGAPPDSLDVQSSPLVALSNPGFPVDLAQWSPTFEPYTTPIAAHITGARLTFFFNNNALGVDPVPSVPALAVFNADGTVTNIAPDSSPAGLAQARNFPYDYTLALSTASPAVLTLTQHDASVPTDRTITWTSSLLNSRASPSQGAFAWLWTPGRVVEITGESFTPPSAPHPSATLVLPGLDVPTAKVDQGTTTVTGFSNGYGAVRRLVRSAQADLAAESTADLPSFIDTTEIPGDWSFLAPAPSVDPGASSASRPFASSVAWNIPAAALPSDPNSAALCDLLWNGADATAGNLNVEYKDYSFPVYYAATGTDPNATLPRSNDTYTVSCAGKPINGTSIPWNSAWTIPAGTDGQVIVLDPATGREWDLWQVSVDTSHKVVTCANGTVLADYRTGNGQNLPSRAIGIQYLAMLPRPWEVTQGRIDHCLPMGIINVLKVGGTGRFVAPAIKEDATGAVWGTDPGIPEGTRFVWSFTDAQRDAWLATLPAPRQAAARVLANAMREYGAVVTDHSGGWHIQLEDRASAGAAWDALGLVDDTTTRDLLGGLITATNSRAVAPPPYPAFTGKLLSWADGVPLDLRFETDPPPTTPTTPATKLDHQTVRWDAAGSGRFFVREPAGSTSAADFRAMLYYGKAGVTVSEENVSQVWRVASMAIDPTTGADITGRGRTFPRFGAVTNTFLDGRPAVAVADQTGGYLRRTNSDLLVFDGLGPPPTGGPTEEFWAVIGTASSGNVARLGGDTSDATQTYQRARFTSWAEAVGTTSKSKANVLQVGAQWWDAVNTKYNSQSTESLAGIADGKTPRHFFCVHRSATFSAVYDGEDDVSSADTLGTAVAGTIHPQSYDNFSIGAATATQNTSPGMTMGLYVVWPKALSATWRAMLDRTQRDSSLCWAVGAEDTYQNADSSPVGKPWRDSISANTLYDFTTHAYDSDAGASVVATAVTPGADTLATYSIPTTAPDAGKLLVAPVAGGPAGVGRPVVTLSDGTKTAKVKPYLAISGSVIIQQGGSEGLAPAFPASATIKGPVAIGALQATYDALTGPEIAGGVTILVTPGGSLSGGLNFAKDGASASNPIVVRVGTKNAAGQIVDPGSFPGATISGQAQINGNHNWVRGVRANGGANISAGVTGGRFNRCLFSGGSAFCDDSGVSSTWDWCEFTGQNGVMFNSHPSQGSRNLWAYRSWWHTPGVPAASSNAFVMCIIGNSARDQWSQKDASPILANPVIQDCLCSDNDPSDGRTGHYSNTLEAKGFNVKFLRCTNLGTPGGRPPRFVIRHSENSIIQACYASNGGFSMRGRDNVIADCYLASGNDMGPSGGNVSYSTWKAYSLQHVTDSGPYPTPANNYPNSEGAIMAGIASGILVGYDPSGGDVVFPTGSIIEDDCTGTITKDNAGIAYTSRVRKTPAYRETPGGPIKKWIIWTTSGSGQNVGPNGNYRASD